MQAFFLDLDGTLLDPKPGITGAIQHALREMGVEDIPTSDELTWCIGPPLWTSFETLLGPGVDLNEAVDHYREHYTDEAMFQADVYDGIGEMLEEMHATEAQMWIATSKPHSYANTIIDHFGISSWVDGLFGSELDGTHSDKSELLANALAETGVDPAQAVMLGDRRFDIEGARFNNIRSIGALWGYADPGELQEADPDALASTPEEVVALAQDLLE